VIHEALCSLGILERYNNHCRFRPHGGRICRDGGLPLYTIRQIRETKSAAAAARDAANETLAESRRSYQRYAASVAYRLVSEAKIHVDNKAWGQAALRLGDLADQALQLASADPGWGELADELRKWEADFRRISLGYKKGIAATKWNEFLVRLHREIARYHGPFPAAGQEMSNDVQ
jgi:hypothetical protein